MEYKFADIVDIAKLQELNNLFYKATGILTAILDLDGNILTASGWREICTKFHRENIHSRRSCIESDTEMNKLLLEDNKYSIYKCKNGLIDAMAPVFVQGKHIASVFTGQILFNKPDLDFFIRQGRKFGFDESDYLKALLDVPIIDEGRLEHVMNYLCSFAEILGEMGLKEIEQQEAQEKIQAANEELEASQRILIATLEELRNQYDKLQEKVI